MRPLEVMGFLATLTIPVIPMGALHLCILTFDAIAQLSGGEVTPWAGALGGASALVIFAAALSLIYLIARPYLTTTPSGHHGQKP